MNETKLGQLIDAYAGRDAVHIALAPVIAYEDLLPGEHIGFVEPNDTSLAGSAHSCAKTIGIVDPYLRAKVLKGQWFFMCLYPQTTTGLRHVWTHPSFSPDEPDNPNPSSKTPSDETLENSRSYMESIADDCGIDYVFLMQCAKNFVDTGDVTVQEGSETWRDNFPYPADEFWRHYEILTGLRPQEKTSIFCCTC